MSSPYPTPQEITSNLLVIAGENFQEIKKYRVNRDRVWRDRAVNMAGAVRNTLLGEKVTIDVTIGAIDVDRAKQLYDKLKVDYFDVAYYDPHLKAVRTASFYVDGLDLELFQKQSGLFPEVQITFNSVSLYNA